MKKLLLFLLFFAFRSVAVGQNYSLEIKEKKVSFGNTQKLAYSTSFQLPEDIVKKAWWKYIKRYALLSNKRTHHENRVLAKKSQAPTDINFFSQLRYKNDMSTLNIALDDSRVSESNLIVYNEYLKDLLLDFKIKFYSSHIQSKVDRSEKESGKVSSKIEKLTRSNLKLESSKKKKNASVQAMGKKINVNNNLIEKARIELFAYQSEMKRLMQELEGIK